MRKTVAIPAGVDNGVKMSMAGEGQPGTAGGPNGNFYLEIQVQPHVYFRRRQDDILLDLSINIAQATLGTDVDVPTVDGPSRLKIPAGSQPGKVFNLKGKGVPHLRGAGRGDQLVVVAVETPTKLTPEQRKLFEELAKTMGTEISLQDRSFFDKLKDFLDG